MDGPCSDIPNSSSVNDLDFSDSSAHTISDAGAFVYIEGADGVPSENSTAAILHFCKLKVLKPYFRLLSVLGWRPILYQWRPFEHHIFVKLINWTYTLLVMSLIICGYVLQYMTCYRHDGFPSDSFSPVAKVPGDKFNTVIKNEMSYLMPNYSQENENHLVVGDEKRELIAANSSSGERNLCPGNLIALYVLPDLLHFIAYLLVLYVMRNPESERSENLMERSFLQTSRTTNWFVEHRKLVKTLRLFLWLCMIWVLLSMIGHIVHVFLHKTNFHVISLSCNETKLFLLVLSVITLSLNDLICAAIVTSYSVHCQLNIFYIRNLCRSMTEKRIDFQEFYKRVEESRKFVDYLNSDQALCVSPLIINFSCRSLVAIYALLKQPSYDWSINAIVSISICFLQWLSLLIMPLVQGFRLTDACTSLQELGQVLRARPFGYQDAPQENLDSLLLYTTALHMQAKILHIPIRGSSIALFVFILITILLLLGQISY